MLPICACGGQTKAESLSGEYAPVLWFLDSKSLVLNDNDNPSIQRFQEAFTEDKPLDEVIDVVDDIIDEYEEDEEEN